MSTAALTVFMKAVVLERRIPFEVRTEQLDKEDSFLVTGNKLLNEPRATYGSIQRSKS